MKKSFVILLSTILITGCSFIKNSSEYNRVSQEAILDLVDENLEEVLDVFALEGLDSVQIGKLKIQLENFRRVVIENFGNQIELKFITASKQFSTEDDVEDVTNLVIQVENKTHYGYFTIKIDDGVGKVLNISLQEYKEEIPNTRFFWLMMVVPLSVFGVNIFSIVKIAKSDFSRKWLLILICFILNVPVLNIYVDHFTFEIAFQFLLGISFNLLGYNNYVWSCALPIGAFISLYAISKPRKLKETIEIDE